ncbi:translesion DNA synthesis-associated protein ImuA [uncultured Paraglaciecola sp.]|jgi:cell division inhibitor SulA|uniref:translesion DNA synthesis-associated protein ImuA n=1 Tax=uncultured Paraglaciecola sp. TaxID=1765024 RepID=UPI0025DE5A48|nr:translesion DNA synthesis-associated protein ImuA [uncultured Paraglaciecola sp.]
MHPTISYLKNKNLLWQANHTQSSDNGQHTGFKELDNALQGGFPEYGVIDIRSQIGIGELRLLLPSILTRQQQRQTELITLIAPPMSINSEMLAEFGFTLDQVMVVQPSLNKQVLWSAEQSLKSGCCHSVVLWHVSLSVTQVKRLQLAAEKGNSLLFIIRQPQQEHISLPVTLGIKLSPSKVGINAQITKRKGSWSNAPFNIYMGAYWPELSQSEDNNVLLFPSRAYRAG